MFYIRKHRYDDGTEYIDAGDVLDMGFEDDPKIQAAFNFLALVEAELNYYVCNTSTAFGNPDLSYARGKVVGYCIAKGWDWTEKNGIITIRKGKRTLYKIEKPEIPEAEIQKRKDISQTFKEMGL